jgi:hypothetical protein
MKFTIPLMVPLPVEVTVAVKFVVPPAVNELGEAVTVVVVDGVSTTVSVVVPLDAA